MFIKPILPFIEYALNYEYIIQELCEEKDEVVNTCNGQCHLSKRIQETTDDTSGTNPSDKKTEIVEMLYFHDYVNHLNFTAFSSKRNSFFYTPVKYNAVSIDIPDPPPLAFSLI